MLIDCHVHVNHYDESTSKPTEEIAADLFRSMEGCGVDHAVVLTSYKTGPHRPHPEKVIEVFGDDPRITVVEGLRWRGDDQTDLFAMEDRIRDGMIKGIKLYPGYDRYAINDPSLESFYPRRVLHHVPPGQSLAG